MILQLDTLYSSGKQVLQSYDVEKDVDIAKVGEQGVVVSLQPDAMMLKLASQKGKD